MKSSELNNSGLFSTAKGKAAIATIAEHARRRQNEGWQETPEERLLSWESITEFGEFKITVRCEYGGEMM